MAASRFPGYPSSLFGSSARSADGIGARELARLIRADVAISTRVMKVANAASSRRVSTVDSLDGAVARLGVSLTGSLVAGLCIVRQMEHHSGPIAERLKAHQQDSVAVAALAHYLAAETNRVDRNQALLAGLIHGVGVLPVLGFAGTQPALARDEAALDALIGAHSARLGAETLAQWHFPKPFIEVAAGLRNHSHEEDDDLTLLDVVAAARLQTQFDAGTGDPDDPVAERFDLVSRPLDQRTDARAEIRAMRSSLLS